MVKARRAGTTGTIARPGLRPRGRGLRRPSRSVNKWAHRTGGSRFALTTGYPPSRLRRLNERDNGETRVPPPSFDELFTLAVTAL